MSGKKRKVSRRSLHDFGIEHAQFQVVDARKPLGGSISMGVTQDDKPLSKKTEQVSIQ